ncbi:MAG: SDR family oxidoreductase [Myxococcales bacterium]|nr:MAG: SDR family oxidoreductase [Myxococcales bacterium]
MNAHRDGVETSTRTRAPSALVVGASRGLGRGVVEVLASSGFAVAALGRSRAALEELAQSTGITSIVADAASEGVAERVLFAESPDLLVVVAGATPELRPLHLHTWETFSKNWEADARIAFEWVRASLLVPLRPGAHVIVFSSGAAVAGSSLSGGYAGAKRAVWFLTEYAAAESGRLGLGIRFQCVVPALTPTTTLGQAAIRAYAERLGIAEEAYAARFGPPLTPALTGEAVLQLHSQPEKWAETTYRLAGAGLRPV